MVEGDVDQLTVSKHRVALRRWLGTAAESMRNLGAAMRQSLQRVKAAGKYCENQACFNTP